MLRREFLTLLTAALAAPIRPAATETTVTILHTNDTHSQIEPFPQGTRNEGLGGVARRAQYVRRVKEQNPNTLLIDAGDFFQGTPYFNFYRGEVEIKAMSAIGYDVVTLGNHDFDNGVEALVAALQHASFDIVCCNYDFGSTPLAKIVKPYVVKKLGQIKVGVFGLGIDFIGLVLEKNHKGIRYLDPVESARKVVEKLRNEEAVDLVIAASHLGTKYEKEPHRMSDLKLVEQVRGIDFIAGGHTHSFMKQPEVYRHPDGSESILFQVGFGGINVGRVDFMFRERQLLGWKASLVELANA
ncbi:MAG: metallophosphatase [Acidobacteriota bacterium]|nr:metallophosphatase [Blastocatellia bacterium]MDW8411813.1 metallophosphatase [Acidobacteriota bacterium]